jgi:hypothetical protein
MYCAFCIKEKRQQVYIVDKLGKIISKAKRKKIYEHFPGLGFSVENLFLLILLC